MSSLEKVVHVTRRFVPECWGGTEGMVYHVSRELIRQGIDSRVHCTAMLAEPGADILDSVPIMRHRYVFPWLGLSSTAKQALRLKGGSPLSLPLFLGLLGEENVSLIHTHVQHRLGGMARTVARMKGIPYVVSLHGGYLTLPSSLVDDMTRPFDGKLEWGKAFGALFGARRVLADADGIICVGRAEYDEVRRRYPDLAVFLLPNGVDVERFSGADAAAFRRQHGFSDSERIVLCVSRIDPQKNQMGLIRAFARFSEKHAEHRLMLLGPVAVESYHAKLEAEVGHLGLAGKVRIIDGLHPEDPLLPSAYKAAEMFVLPSIHEPFGMVVLEAWAAGVPVLASRIGGIADVAVDRQTALLVEPDCEEQMAAGMAEMADNTALRDALSARALSEVQSRYDWRTVSTRLRAIYEEIILAH